MPGPPRLLFVDDEPGIRTTLAAILRQQGFEVTVASTVSEALNWIARQSFDVLISDLNIGEAGDGFTVVSAMRRTQPQAATFILTGYPAFETALEAIRQQVDDYFVKPAKVQDLVEKIQARLNSPRTEPHHIQIRRLPDVLQEHRREIFSRWLAAVKGDRQVDSTALTEQELTDQLPLLIDEIVIGETGQKLSAKAVNAAQRHGSARFQQGSSIPSMIREARLLHEVISLIVQENLLAVEVSFLITDIMQIGETIQAFLEESIRSFLDARQAAADKAQNGRGKSILLLSADRELSLLRDYALQSAGFAVARADSRQEALRLLESEFEALVISYSLSGDDMMEMAELFRKRNPKSPVIGVTRGNWQDLKINPDFTLSGEDGPEALLEVLETALSRTQLLRVK
ncbi:MAG TPA: response regulator [Acidobacteriaceae bacterium]|nr:response regulator [Acidobacteriaceae bacterium]